MDAVVAAAEDVMAAIQRQDAKALARALRAAFEICDAMPHVEGEHVEEETFDIQNSKAARKGE